MNIRKKQLLALFFCSLVPWIAGNGLIPLLPIYAAQLGANSAIAGIYLAISYLALTLGAISAGWVSNRLRRHRLPLVITGCMCIPASYLMGQVSSMAGLIALTAILWFCGGLAFALVNILAGLSAGEHERGKVFGILALTIGLGALIGNLGIGWLVERWGYPAMFNILAVFMILLPLTSLFLAEKEAKPSRSQERPAQKTPGVGKAFPLMFSASLLVSVTGFFILLIRSIVMDSLDFSPLEISSTGAVGGAIAMPFPLLMGWLSDRIERKKLMIAGYLAALASIVLLAFSQQLWNFWLVLALQSIATGTTNIGNALVTDLAPREALGKSLAIFSAAGWIGGVLGFALSGVFLQNLGLAPTLVFGGVMAVAAAAFLIPVRETRNKNAVVR